MTFLRGCDRTSGDAGRSGLICTLSGFDLREREGARRLEGGGGWIVARQCRCGGGVLSATAWERPSPFVGVRRWAEPGDFTVEAGLGFREKTVKETATSSSEPLVALMEVVCAICAGTKALARRSLPIQPERLP